MKADQVDEALRQKFIDEGQRLVFWNDESGEFADYVDDGLPEALAGVQLLDMRATGGLSAKLLLEREDPQGKYLIYSDREVPPVEHDFLLDIRLYSAAFRGDMASLWLQELGLNHQSLRSHLQARKGFLGSQVRRGKLRALLKPEDDVAELDLKMMAVLAGSSGGAPMDTLRALCHAHLKDGAFNLATASDLLVPFEKMGLQESFWTTMAEVFGYAPESLAPPEPPTLAGLLRGLFVSELFHQMPSGSSASLASIAHFALPENKRSNASVFLAQWRDSVASATSYDAVAEAIGQQLDIEEALSGQELAQLRGVFTFKVIEKILLRELKTDLLAQQGAVDVEAMRAVVTDREGGHWLGGAGKEVEDRQALASGYRAILAAAELFSLREQYSAGFSFAEPDQFLAAYRDDLCRFDRLYRDFFTEATPVRQQGWDLLKNVITEVENLYQNSFLDPLGIEWSRLLDAGFLDHWQSEAFPPQQDFYKNHIDAHLKESDRKRAFVIISDAFRYEAAEELTERLRHTDGLTAEISPMLGVLPSYTALGMASLLPHEALSYTADGKVLADGHPTDGVQGRDAILSTVDGMACQASQVRGMKTNDLREFTADKKVVYIYHNVIDARGDSASTESGTFDAVKDCIEELRELVKTCTNKLSASKVWVTADHGFLFQEKAPDETGRTSLAAKPESAVKAKKRYVIGPDLHGTSEVHEGETAQTAGAGGDMLFWIPRGSNRFHFVGGARFVHGGAMPQEVVVPVVTATSLRGSERDKAKATPVGIQFRGLPPFKVTTSACSFEIIQTDTVGGRYLPLRVKVAIYEGAQPVSSVVTETFASESTMNMQKVRLDLAAGPFEKSTKYRLICREVDTGAEVLSADVVIDRSFEDDF